MDKEDANLLPKCCSAEFSSSSSSSSESSDSDESCTDVFNTENKYARVKRSKRKLKKKQSKWKTYWTRYKRFLNSPRVHYVYDILFYLIFLLLFSYMILCEFNYYEILHKTIENKTPILNNKSSSKISMNNFTYNYNYTANISYKITKEKISYNHVKNPAKIEYVLIYWIFAFALEELRQVGKIFKSRKLLN